MIYGKADEVIEELSELRLNRHHMGLETSVKGSYFVFDCINLLHFNRHKINLKRVGSYIDSPDWIKNKKATINPIYDDKSFQCAAIVALNHEEIGINLQRVPTITFFVNKYYWKGTNYRSGKDDSKKNSRKIIYKLLLMCYMFKK